MKTHYDVLGVNQSATQEQIKLAYRKLSKQHHPDVSGGSKESERIFLEVQEAYKILKDPTAREAYDARLHGSHTSSNPKKEDIKNNRERTTGHTQQFDMNDIERNFEHFFGFNPKTKETSSTLHKTAKKNPLDTTELFERFFRK